MKKIIAYGSLREKATWFNELVLKGLITKKDTIKIDGFSLYNLLDPDSNEILDYVACKLDSKDSSIIADIIEVDDTIYEYVCRVIKVSDFKIYSIIINGEECSIFIYEKQIKQNLRIVSGDYFEKRKHNLITN